MIGSGLKKLGKEHGLTPFKGKLIGNLGGFPAVLWEGAGFKAMVLNLGDIREENAGQPVSPATLLTKPEKEYRIQQYASSGPFLRVTFFDNPGTMKRIQSYISTELPVLRLHGFTGAERCSQCHEPMNGEQPLLYTMGDVCPMSVHSACAGALEASHSQAEQEDRALMPSAEKPRSSPLAPLGALLGGIVGCVPWVLIGLLGFIAAYAAMLIGLGANFGHKLFGGQPGKARMALVIIITLLLVPVAQMAGEAASLAKDIVTGDLQKSWDMERDELTVEDTLPILRSILQHPEGRAEFMKVFMKNLMMGYLFAGLGVWSLWRRLSSENLPQKMPALQRVGV